MPARPIWRGHLRLALVSCPVALWNAKHDHATIRSNMINDRFLDFRERVLDVTTVAAMLHYASSYYLAPDGDAGHDVYAVLLRAVAETGKVALARVLIGQGERTIALRAMPGGLVAHTLDEQRDINDARSILGDAAEIKTDPEMVALAKQRIQRQTTTYDPSDLEDRYESRLRSLIDAKLKGEGIAISEPAEPDRTNVVDLMAALKKSLSQGAAPKKVPQSSAPANPKRAAAAQAAKPGRKRAQAGTSSSAGHRSIRRPSSSRHTSQSNC